MGRRTRIFLSLYLGFAAYCALVLVLGKTGIVATGELRHYEQRLQANLTHLESTNRQLVDRLDALQSNPATIRLEARQLLYLEPNQGVIQVTGYHPPESSFAVGALVSEKKHTMTSDSVSRIIGLAVALTVFILFGLFSRRQDDSEKRR